MDQSAKLRRKCHILDLPNEVLQMIVSSLPLQKFVQYHDDSGREKAVSQILILMSICRRFRHVCYEIGFWLEPNFSFTCLLPENTDNQLQVRREYSLITALLNDKRILRSLAQRYQWTFKTAESMLLVILNVDQVCQNMRMITLERVMEVNFAIRKLSWLHHLTDLIIVCTCYPINFGAIANCRSLKRFDILELKHVYDCLGTLRKATLHSLLIAFLRRRNWIDNQFQTKLVAVDSAATLTSLEVLNCNRMSTGSYRLKPLKLFANLTQIKMLPLCKDFCDLLIAASCRLTTFAVMFEVLGNLLPKYVRMLEAPSLSQLENLIIYFASDDRDVPLERYISSWTQILDAVVSHQQSVKYLELHSIIEGSWCSHFARLANLKSLRWIIPIDQFYSNCNTRDIKEYEQWVEEQKSEIEFMLDMAFVSISSYKPSLSIEFRDHFSFEEPDRGPYKG